jgi:hypothetical protein
MEVRLTLQLGPGRTVNIAQAVVRAGHEGRVSLQFVQIAIEEQRRLAEYINAIALPINVGRPRRQLRLPAIEVVLVAIAGLVVIFLILSMITRVGAPAR